MDVFYNANLPDNIHQGNTSITIHCNAGIATTNMVSTFPRYGQLWYHKNGIANILPLRKVKEKNSITFDSDAKNKFHVHRPDYMHIFKQLKSGLYYLDTC
jgi:hypothetical protein